MRKPRVLVAMSGGVDSSVAAALLVEQGCDVIGATMKLFCYSDETVSDRPCCSLDSIFDARSVADRLGIPHYTLNLADRFGRDVGRAVERLGELALHALADVVRLRARGDELAERGRVASRE